MTRRGETEATAVTMTCVASWTPPAGARHVGHSPGLVRAAVLGAGGEVVVIEPRTGAPLASLQAPERTAWVAVGDDGVVAAIDGERAVRVFDAAAGAWRKIADACGIHETARVDTNTARDVTRVGPEHVVFAPVGDCVAVSERTFDDFETYYGGGSLYGDSATLVIELATGRGQVLLRDSASGTITYSAADEACYSDHARAAEFSPDGRVLALVMRDERVVLHVRGAAAWARVEGPRVDEVRAIAFAGATRLLLARGQRVLAWDLERAAEGEALVVGEEVTAVAGDDRRIACVVGDAARVYVDGAWVATTPRFAAPPAAVRWRDELLAVRGADGSLALFAG